MPVEYLFKSSALLLSFMAMPYIGFSQASLGTLLTTLPDTAKMQQLLPIKVVVKNTGNAAFSGPIDIYYAVDPNYMPAFLINFTPSTLLNPNNIDSVNTTIFIDNIQFHQGSNIVVVWSTGNGITTTDQSWKIIYIDTTTSVDDLWNINSRINMYPNPASSALTIEINSSQYNIECVRILDLLGNQIKNISGISLSTGNKMRMDVSMLYPGVYMLECINSKGNFGKKKFIKYPY